VKNIFPYTKSLKDITVKSKGHPLDVLKTVRDRIKMQEVDEFFTNDDSEPSSNSNLLVEEESSWFQIFSVKS
jgi:hypothetical protein